MEKIKAIFWDNDGILVDTEHLYFEANKIVYSNYGVELNEEIYVEYYLKRAKGGWHLLRQKGFDEEEIVKIRNERNECYIKLLEEKSKPIDGAEDVLKMLHGKIKMGVVTSSRKDHFDIIHSRTGFKKYFDFIITSDDIDKVKPDPGPYLKALEISGLKKEECIIIEDSERGLKAALAAGIKCYIIPTQLTRNSNFTGADKILNDIYEIVKEVTNSITTDLPASGGDTENTEERMEKINVKEKFLKFTEHWRPKVAAQLNGQEVKLVKFKGEFVWHKHDDADEMFFVWKGKFGIEFRDKTVELKEGEFIVVPKGVEHRPFASEEVEVILFEPADILNTGNVTDENFTAPKGDII